MSYRNVEIQYDPYEELANAIVLRAFKDYKKALKKDSVLMKRNCERFFESNMYEILTNVPADYLMKIAVEQVRAGDIEEDDE